MKKIVLLLLLTNPVILSAQSFIDNDKKWHIYVWDLESTGETTEAVWWTDIYKFEGDTLIDSVNFSILYKTKDSTLASLEQSRYCREEADKVYMWDQTSQQQILLYDFGLATGDSIITQDPIHLTDSIALKVDSVQYLDYFGVNRKTMYLKIYGFLNGNSWYCYDDEWIAGIGSKYGLLRNINWCIIGLNYTEETLCVYESSDLIYASAMSDNYGCYFNSIPEANIKPQNEAIISIIPNPINQNSNIRIILKSGTPQGIIEVYSISGRRILTQKVVDDQIRMDKWSNDLASGLYMVKYINENGVCAFERFIKP